MMSIAEARTVHEQAGYFPARAAEYGEDVSKRLGMGGDIRAVEYLKGRATVERAKAEFAAALEQVDAPLVEAARTLGAMEGRIFREILLPLAWPGLAAGMVLTFARALGDFGATLILAGNIPGRTQTLPLAIFFAVEAGDTQEAVRWSLVAMGISLAALGALNLWTRHRRGLAMRVVQEE
jgi:ABC-type sulfate transport system permease subunit